MVANFYLIVFIISVGLTVNILIKNRKIDNILILFSILLNINLAGQYLIAISESVEMAIWGNKIMYIGGCYLPFVIFIFATRLSNIRISRFFKIFLLAYATVVLFFVMSIGYYPWYYVSVTLAKGNGFNYLVKDYGPLHALYPSMMIFYVVLLISLIFFVLRKKTQLPTNVVVTIALICSSLIFTYLFERLLKSKVSYLPVGYLIVISLLLKNYDRINMYDMSTNILSSIEKLQEYGYIVIDKHFRYISSNENIKILFPEVNQWKIDSKVPESDSCLYQEIIKNLVSLSQNKNDSKIISVNNRFFQVDIKELIYRKKNLIGFLIEFVDRTAEQNYYNTIEDYNSKLEKEVQKKTEHITHIKDMLILGLAEMVESRDSNTGGHIKRTSKVVGIFAEKLLANQEKYHLSEDFLSLVVKAAPMHDLGKISIDDQVLRQPGKYTPEEYEEMKRHSLEGAKRVKSILEGVEDDAFVKVATNIAYYHHEKWNGMGYPTGKKETEIPVEARIMALADVFDALVSKRCYKEAFSYDEAFNIVKESLGEHFDPELGDLFLTCREELEIFYNEMISNEANIA